MRRLLYFALGFVLVTAGCGRRGDPAPPVPVVPEATTDLVVSQRGPAVILAWSYPSLTAAGTKLPAISRINVYRYVEDLPASVMGSTLPSADPGAVEPNRPVELQLFARQPQLSPDQFRKLRERIASISSEELPTFVQGARIVFEDRPAFRTSDDRPVRIHYSVGTESVDAESAISNLVTIVPHAPPGAPRNLRVLGRPEGVALEWEAPASDAVQPVAYNVYRFPATGPIVELGKPVNEKPIAETRYVDAPPYGSYRYIVMSVRDVGPPVIESEATPTIYAEFKDLVPPAVPSNVVTLREATAVRVVWDLVEAADLAGYKVYRTTGGQRTLLTPQPLVETTYRDASPAVGKSHTYSVTSIDRSGNESAHATAPEIVLPR